jgi:hypothetical protein
MSRSQRFFRVLWRANAILILVAAGAVTFGVGAFLVAEFGSRSALKREAEAGLVVAGPQADPRLSLAPAIVLSGTHIMRAQLVLYKSGGGFSSSGYGETRNLLFLEPGDKAARWLLPDNQHAITDNPDMVADEDDSKAKRIVATAALVKPTTGQLDVAKGKLLLFDPAAKHVIEVADAVRKIHVASVVNGEISLLYERDRRLVMARFDGATLARRGEEEIDVPQLK